MNITLFDKYQTKKNGYKVDILCVNGPNKVAPIAGHITYSKDSHSLVSWQPGGINCSAGYNGEYDLVPVPPLDVPAPQPDRTSMNIVVGGKYQTRGDTKYPSRLVRILATDMKGADGTVIGLVIGTNGSEFPCCWKANGKSLELGVTESIMDLVPVPGPKPEKYHGYLMLSRWTRFFLLTEEEAKKQLPHTHEEVRVRLEDDY